MIFFPGLHHPSDAHKFPRCMISIMTIKNRRSDFSVNDWILDSGAFSQVAKKGGFEQTPEGYAKQIERWAQCGKLLAAVSQDYMCEPFVLQKTGLTVTRHQWMTTERYERIREATQPAIYIMPVIQGFLPSEYVNHVRQYGDLLAKEQWTGVGSVCKRNARLEDIENVLVAIKESRSDLRLHGFGVKTTALESSIVRDCLYSADSMAWSFAARYEWRDGNDPKEAKAFTERIEKQTVKKRDFQRHLFV